MLTQMPEVVSVVLGDQMGTLSDAQNEPDAEAVAAVMGYLSSAAKQSGEALGFGTAQKVTITGPNKACVLYIKGTAVVTIYVDPHKSIVGIEKKIEQALQI